MKTKHFFLLYLFFSFNIVYAHQSRVTAPLQEGQGGESSLRLPVLYSDGVVLQRDHPLPIHGWAEAGASITVKLGRKHLTTTADANGCWQVTLPAQKAAGPLTLTVESSNETLQVNDVWLGDVWMVSGQSNIDTHIERVYPQYPTEIDNDSTTDVRLFQVDNTISLKEVRDDVKSSARWQTLSKKNAWHFSALGYFLGKQMAAEKGVHQGIIQSSWGGTPIEAWLPMDSVQAIIPQLAAEARFYADEELNRRAAAANGRASQWWNQILNTSDPGMTEQWMNESYDDSAWPQANQYQLPIKGRGIQGSYWTRQRIHVDASHAGQAARLLVGTLIDADFTYVNGKLVGQTGYQYPPRRYNVPAGLLHEGDNVLTVRFVCHGARPTFISEKPYKLIFSDGTEVPLSETWRVHDGITQLPQQPSMPTGNQNTAATLWNAMLAPLGPLALSGVVWYQGESNTSRAEIYERELTALMNTWRARLQQPELPFAIVHLAGYMAPHKEPQESSWPRLRESQRRAAVADARASIVPAHDLGEANDIHPLRKKEVAARCAQVLNVLTEGQKKDHKTKAQKENKSKVQKDNSHLSTPFPAVLRAEVENGHVVITFDQPLRQGAVHGFEICEANGRFRNVTATAKGCQVTLDATTAHRVRYAWKDNPIEADCIAQDGISPAVPFEVTVKE